MGADHVQLLLAPMFEAPGFSAEGSDQQQKAFAVHNLIGPGAGFNRSFLRQSEPSGGAFFTQGAVIPKRMMRPEPRRAQKNKIFSLSKRDVGVSGWISRPINGSPGRIRTYDQPVNSRLLYR
jgi:hypothetical protein